MGGAVDWPPGFVIEEQVCEGVDPGFLQGQGNCPLRAGIEDTDGGYAAVVAVEVCYTEQRCARGGIWGEG